MEKFSEELRSRPDTLRRIVIDEDTNKMLHELFRGRLGSSVDADAEGAKTPPDGEDAASVPVLEWLRSDGLADEIVAMLDGTSPQPLATGDYLSTLEFRVTEVSPKYITEHADFSTATIVHVLTVLQDADRSRDDYLDAYRWALTAFRSAEVDPTLRNLISGLAEHRLDAFHSALLSLQVVRDAGWITPTTLAIEALINFRLGRQEVAENLLDRAMDLFSEIHIGEEKRVPGGVLKEALLTIRGMDEE